MGMLLKMFSMKKQFLGTNLENESRSFLLQQVSQPLFRGPAFVHLMRWVNVLNSFFSTLDDHRMFLLSLIDLFPHMANMLFD